LILIPTGGENHLCATAATQQVDRREAGLSLHLQGELDYSHIPKKTVLFVPVCAKFDREDPHFWNAVVLRHSEQKTQYPLNLSYAYHHSHDGEHTPGEVNPAHRL